MVPKIAKIRILVNVEREPRSVEMNYPVRVGFGLPSKDPRKSQSNSQRKLINTGWTQIEITEKEDEPQADQFKFIRSKSSG